MTTRYRRFIFFLLVVIFLFPQITAAQEISPMGNFRWVFGMIMPDDSFQRKTENRIIQEQPENELLLYFLPISNSFLYLFTITPDNKFRLLFPDTFTRFETSAYHYKSYEFHKADILPAGIPDPGHKSYYYNHYSTPKSLVKIYVLVSTQPLKEFEKLIRGYKSSCGSRKTRLFADILMELTRLKNRRYLINTSVIPWETSFIYSNGETAQGMEIELLAQQFNYYFMTVYTYEY